MISEADFNGGAIAITTSTSLHRASKRVISCYNSSSINVTLPDPAGYRSFEYGGPYWFVLAHGSGSVVIKKHDGTTIKTLTTGQSGSVWLSSSGFRVRQKTINTGRALHNSTRSAVTSETPTPTYVGTPCFFGDDCDFASYNNVEPLDGRDGRDLVILPFFEDVRNAQNTKREPIRASDLVMPSVVSIRFKENEFTADALHPEATTVLPQAFYDQLYKGGQPHALTYQGTLHGESRHWLHVRYNGSTWALGSPTLTVRRHYWNEVLNYTGDDGATYTLEIRLVAEHTVNPEPLLVPVGGGGQNDASDGIWGTKLSIYVFCDQLQNGFVDGGTWTPVGAPGAVAFTKADPCAWGDADGVTGSLTDQKYCHPQLVLAGSLPTTLHAHLGKLFVPYTDRAEILDTLGPLGTRGRNRDYCYEVSNGAPWTPGTCTTAVGGGVGIERNVVFGYNSGNYGAMTLGGGRNSKPIEWVCWENGRAEGRTYLVPSKPGWNEECGVLDIAGGNSATFTVCTDDKNGIDEGTGRPTWPGFVISQCTGHPDEPLDSIGGTHACFNNNGSSTGTNCCVTLGSTNAQSIEVCKRSEERYGDQDSPSTCAAGPSNGCAQVSDIETSFELAVEDYDYSIGTPTAREATWLRLIVDPTYVPFDYTYDPGDVADFVSETGTWSKTSTIDVTAYNGAHNVKSLLLYEPAGASLEDFRVTGRFRKASLASHGVAVRGYTASTLPTMYGAIITPTGGTNATVAIKEYAADSPTTLVSVNINNLTSDDVAFDFEVWGTTLIFKWTVSGQSQQTLTIDDCTLTVGGWAGVYSESASTSVQFSDLVIYDRTLVTVEVRGTLQQTRVNLDFPAKAQSGYGTCSSTFNSDCGTPPMCGCFKWTDTLETTTNAEHFTGSDIVMPACVSGGLGSGDNPTQCGADLPDCTCNGLWCSGSFYRPCNYDNCREPYPALSWCLPTDCEAADQANMCKGITYWVYPHIVCV